VFEKYPHGNCKVATDWSQEDDAYGANYGDNCTIVTGDFKNLQGGLIYSTLK
jgi:hypothetical protein